jgi:hypothetical protein
MKYFPSVMGNESISSRPRVYWLYQLLECWKGVNGRNLETPRTWRTFGYGYAEYACPDMIIHDFMFNGHWVAQTVLSFFFSLEFGTRDIAFLASLELLSGSEKTYLSLDLLEQKLLSTEFFNDGAMCAILPATTLLHYKLMKLVFERFGLLVEFVVNTEDAGPVKNQVCIRQGIFQGSVRTMLMLPDFQVFDPCSDVGDGRGRFTQHDHLQLESVILMRVSKPEAPIFSPYPTTLNAKAVVQSGVENFENDVMVFRLAKEQASGVKKIK